MFIKEYTDFSLTQAGIKSILEPTVCWGAYFKLDNDIRLLFPYINSEVPDAKYYDNPEYIQFTTDCFQCTLYPIEVMAAPFKDQYQALEFVQWLIEFLNDLYDRKDSLKPDYKRYKQVAILDIFKLLPGTNCKECGFLTCMAFAAALSKNKTSITQCPYFIKPISEKAIYPVYDREGNLTKTVSIEIDVSKTEPPKSSQQNKIPVKITNTEVQAELTHREVEVLRLVAEGRTNTEISETLSVSPHTVKSHVVHIFNKLGVNDRTQAAVWASKNKIL